MSLKMAGGLNAGCIFGEALRMTGTERVRDSVDASIPLFLRARALLVRGAGDQQRKASRVLGDFGGRQLPGAGCGLCIRGLKGDRAVVEEVAQRAGLDGKID